MRGQNNRQSTVHRMRLVKRSQHAQRKGGKRTVVSRRPPAK